MKICILTWLHNQNFGTLLQAYALQQFLKSEGHDVVDADYLPCVKEKLLNWAINRNSFDLFAGKAHELLNRKKEHDDFGSSTADVFNRFLSQNIVTTERITDTDGLVGLRGKYDAYVCGSDQIWSPYLLNRNFYFSFLSDSDKRIAYAPSFGVTNTTERKKRIIANLLKSFSSVSVREDAGADFVESLGLERPSQVVDPVLLLSKEDWAPLIDGKCPEPGKIVCYFLGDRPFYRKAVESISKELGCEVVTLVGSGKNAVDEELNPRYGLGPDEWLAYLASARFVLTDSLHGTLFSQIFRKDYYCFKRFEETDKRSQNSRVESLARLSTREF